MITRLVKMNFRPESIQEFIQLFESVREDIKASPGCLQLDLLQDKNHKEVFFTYSLWSGEYDLNTYRESPLFKKTWSETKMLFNAKPEAWTTILRS